MVQRVVDRRVKESTSKQETESFLFEENQYKFELATEGPISNTKLVEQLGCLGNSKIAQQLVQGKHDIPDKTDDASALILEEIGRIGVQLTNGEIAITITLEEFQCFWKRVREETASSSPGYIMVTIRQTRTLTRHLDFMQRRSP